MKKILVSFLLLLLAMFLLVTGGFLFMNLASDTQAKAVIFTVNEGESAELIANRLEKSGVIRSSLILRVLSKILGTETEFKKGNYQIPPGLDTLSIHGLLIEGQQRLTKITIPDGYTLSRISTLFENAGITSALSFMQAATDPQLLAKYGITLPSAEGFLFPDTYFFSEQYPAVKVVDYLLSQFFIELEKVYPDYRSLSSRDIQEKVILASIIEREYVDPPEAPLMASVFSNRLSLGKRLESCATVVYIITEIEKKSHPSRIFFRDLERESPYNTYRNAGLPPGPISNPGRIALSAAFNPAKTDYLYFVLKDPDAKQHQFSRTFAEHERATEIYFKK